MNLRYSHILRDAALNDLDELMPNDTPAESATNRTTLSNVISCLSDYDPDALPVPDAQTIIRQFIQPINAVEKVAIRSALDRVLAADIISPINVPSHDNSAMDGYAFRGSDLHKEQDLQLKIVGTAYAGRAYEGSVGSGECVRIMTGAVMPAECDTVIPQEFTRDESEQGVSIPAGVVRTGDNRRLKGEDLAIGTAKRSHPASGRSRPAGLPRHRRSTGTTPFARRFLLDR